MKTIRYDCFETNSSSMHSFVYLNKDDFEKFNKGEGVITDIQSDDSPEIQADFRSYPSYSEFYTFDRLYEDTKDYVNNYYPLDLDSNFLEPELEDFIKDKEDYEDSIRFIKDNYSKELLEFAFSNKRSSLYPFKQGIKELIKHILYNSDLYDITCIKDFINKDWQEVNFEVKDNSITKYRKCATDPNVVYLSGSESD